MAQQTNERKEVKPFGLGEALRHNTDKNVVSILEEVSSYVKKYLYNNHMGDTYVGRIVLPPSLALCRKQTSPLPWMAVREWALHQGLVFNYFEAAPDGYTVWFELLTRAEDALSDEDLTEELKLYPLTRAWLDKNKATQ
jgi:hypothetical protein